MNEAYWIDLYKQVDTVDLWTPSVLETKKSPEITTAPPKGQERI